MPGSMNGLRFRGACVDVWGDIDPHHVHARRRTCITCRNCRCTWDARRLPLEDTSVDRIVCNLPFGKQLSSPEEIGPLYYDAIPEMDRVLRPRQGRVAGRRGAGLEGGDSSGRLEAGTLPARARARPARPSCGLPETIEAVPRV